MKAGGKVTYTISRSLNWWICKQYNDLPLHVWILTLNISSVSSYSLWRGEILIASLKFKVLEVVVPFFRHHVWRKRKWWFSIVKLRQKEKEKTTAKKWWMPIFSWTKCVRMRAVMEPGLKWSTTLRVVGWWRLVYILI